MADIQIKRVDQDGNAFILNGKVSDEQRVTLSSFVHYLDRLKNAALFTRGMPGIERIVVEHGEHRIIGGSYTDAELFELLHLLRPLILHREPASFSAVRTLLGRCICDKPFAAELKEIQSIFDHGQIAQYMQIQIGEQRLFDETLLRTWLNGTQYHTDLEKAAAWGEFERSLTDESVRILLMNQLRDKIGALIRIGHIVRVVLGSTPKKAGNNQ